MVDFKLVEVFIRILGLLGGVVKCISKVFELDAGELVLVFVLIVYSLDDDVLGTQTAVGDVLFMQVFHNADYLFRYLIQFKVFDLGLAVVVLHLLFDFADIFV